MRERDLATLRNILTARGGFGHREHLELAWSYLREYPPDEAAEVMSAAIKHVARLHGADRKYHETVTRTWVHLVAVHCQRWGEDTFDRFLERNGDLLDSRLLTHFYSREAILSEDARAAWISPDMHPLPALA
jgi:hypothetical protein